MDGSGRVIPRFRIGSRVCTHAQTLISSYHVSPKLWSQFVLENAPWACDDCEAESPLQTDAAHQLPTCWPGDRTLRFFTPRECWRLQGFPDKWFRLPDTRVAAGVDDDHGGRKRDQHHKSKTFAGNVGDEERSYAQVNNAVCPPVVALVALPIARWMRKKDLHISLVADMVEEATNLNMDFDDLDFLHEGWNDFCMWL